MKNIKNNIPALRFPEFSGEWEERKLGEIATFFKGKDISKKDILEEGKNECIRYGELYTTYTEVIKKIYSKTNLPLNELVLSKDNDVLIPSSGETQLDIATSSCIKKDNVALSGDINIIRSDQKGEFLSYYLSNKKRIDIAKLSQGYSVVHLYANQLRSLKIHIPTLPEQQKIASFLTAVDEKIEQLSKKKSLLEQYKKGVMQKIFSQEIRFRDENGKDFPKWEKKRLGEVAEKKKEKNIKGIYRKVLTNSAINGIVYQQEYFDKNIANINNLLGYYVVSIDDFVYNPRVSSSAPVGPIKRNKLAKGIMSPLYFIFTFKDVNKDYFEYFFGTSYWHRYMKSVANYGARHDRLNIINNDILKMPLPYPSLPEQRKIADFLTSIDNKISSVETQLEKTKAFKKGLLQKMFV